MTRIARACALLALALLTTIAVAGPATAKKKPSPHGKRAEPVQTLPKVRECLRTMGPQVKVPDAIADRARLPIERMVAIS